MVRCDNCDGTVARTWRRRTRADSMTHRHAEWVCEDCHPELPAGAAKDVGGRRAVADGGQDRSGPAERGWSDTA